MNRFRLKISTPDGNMLDEDIVKLDVRGLLGDLAVMAGHMPFMTALQPGEIRVLLPDGERRTGELGGGLLNVGADVTVLLASGFQWREI